jgi:transcription initiation factor IIF auxiliary subunit
MRKQFDIKVKDSLIDPQATTSRSAQYKDRDKRPLYRVWLYLEGTDLPYVQSVMYKLHPTFPNPLLTIERTVSNPMCKTAIWTWGIFTVEATILTKTGETIAVSHRLTYGSEIEQKDIRLMKA